MGRLPAEFHALNGMHKGLEHADYRSPWEYFLSKSLPPFIQDIAFFKAFQKAFESSEVYSIDRFVFKHSSHEKTAKFFIALILLACESLGRPKGGWYRQLWNDVIIPGFENQSPPLDIVTFNYERSFLAYLRQVSNAYYQQEAEKILTQVKIHHVYGSLGELNGSTDVAYGRFMSAVQSSEFVKLIPPRAESEESIRNTILGKDKVVFLGFGFDELNLRVLGIDETNRPKKIFASRLGLSRKLQVAAEERLGKIIWGDPAQNVEAFIHQSEAFA